LEIYVGKRDGQLLRNAGATRELLLEKMATWLTAAIGVR
jgi:hypothetical protein